MVWHTLCSKFLLTSVVALAFRYCDYKHAETHDLATILGALAYQFIVQNEDCFADLNKFHQAHMTNECSLRTSTPDELCDLIINVSRHFKSAMIVVDGLDETAKNQSKVARLLRNLSTNEKLN